MTFSRYALWSLKILKTILDLLIFRDGQKMSKRKKNYPDPMDIVHKYGADAIRCVAQLLHS